MDITKLTSLLRKYDQEHLLQHWDVLSENERKSLYDELTSLNLDEVVGYFKATMNNKASGKLDDKMTPLSPNQCGSIMDATPSEITEYEEIAYKEIREGKFAILLLAGGQGSRLGVSYPKGMYSVGLKSGKSLFQIQAERILKLESLAGSGKIVWYIMTSASTVEPTSVFFKKHDYFGLDPNQIVIFQQGTLPCFSFEGKILMSSKYSVATSPDGNGGLYKALRKSGILKNMESRKIKYVQLYCVDNILVKVGDPIFSGYCIKKKAECANKVVAKGFPSESVGITCKVDGRYQVVEYSEITDKAAERRNPDGALTFSAANICIHFFTLEFLEKVCNQYEIELEHHIAKKKIPYVNNEGVLVKPEKPNGIKMEKFVFDVFKFAEEFVIWECVREDEFAPLKNATGASDFSPEHCRNALYALNQKMILEAGGELFDCDGNVCQRMLSPAAPKENNNNDVPDNKYQKFYEVEISPLISYAGEGLQKLLKGRKLGVPIYITDESF